MSYPQWNPLQTTVLSHGGSQLVIGAPGSGKSTLLEALAEQGLNNHGAGKVAWACFSFRGLAALEQSLKARNPSLREGVNAATIVTHAHNRLLEAGGAPAFCTNNNVRRILRAVMAAQQFKGTLNEAEHLIKSFKSRAKKVPDNAPHYDLYQAYQKELEKRNLSDRHDIVRQHLLAMRAGQAQPLPVKLMLVDNVQDATEIQLLWLRAHLAAGTTLLMAGDDDLTAYGRDGALGKWILEQIEEWPEVTTHTLAQTYRTSKELTPVVTKVARMLKSRLDKPVEPQNTVPAALAIHAFATAEEEVAWLVQQAGELATQQGAHVGFVTRDDFTANLLAHQLRKAGFNPGSYARNVWDEPVADTILSLLYLLINAADDRHLRNVLHGFGVPYITVKELQTNGLAAANWLPSGAPWPELTTLPLATSMQLNRLGRSLVQGYKLFIGKQVNPRTVFKSMVADLLPHLPPSEHPYALLATDMLLSVSGNLPEALPRLTKETMPDATSPIIVAPAREVRNQTFTSLFMPRFHASRWPKTNYPVIGEDAEHERRLCYLALSRAAGNIHLSYYDKPSPYVAEIETTLAHLGKKRK